MIWSCVWVCMETPPSPNHKDGRTRSILGSLLSGFAKVVGVLFLLFIFLCIVTPPMGGGIKKAPQSSSMQAAHALGLAMYSYANDNNQTYPDGKSSTEVFQQLLDGGYVTDPAIFYIPAPGKIKAERGQKKLKPENVCWDVTAGSSGGLSSTEHTELPLLFLTGYRVSYTPGGAAVPLPKSDIAERTWTQWANGSPSLSAVFTEGAAVFYGNNSAKYANRVTAPDGTSSIPNFVSRDYRPDGKVYRQLTPDGVLPP